MIDADRCWCVLLKWNHTITGAYQIRALIKMGGCQVMTPRRQVESFPSSSAAVAFVAYGHGFRFALDISMCQFSGRWKTCLQPENPTTPVNIIMLLYNTLYYIEVCVCVISISWIWISLGPIFDLMYKAGNKPMTWPCDMSPCKDLAKNALCFKNMTACCCNV